MLGNVFNKQKQASISAPALQTRKIVGERYLKLVERANEILKLSYNSTIFY